MQFRYVIIGLLLAAAVIGARWVLQQPSIAPVRLPAESVPVTPRPAEDPQQGIARAERSGPFQAFGGEDPVLPELNASDSWIRDQLQDIALPWLAETELLRTSAAVLENASRGELPRKFLGFLAPEGKFDVRSSRGAFSITQNSYRRYDGFVATLQSLPPDRAASLFGMLEPLLNEAVRELGVEDSSARELAYRALAVALDTPRLDGKQQLIQPKVMYTYADEALEALPPLQKQLLRMGPENLHSLRLWLEDFGVALSPSDFLSRDARLEQSTGN